MISPANRRLLERMMRRPPPTDDPALKVTLNLGGLCTLLDAAREEGMGEAARAGVRPGKSPAENVEAVLNSLREHLNGRHA